MKNITNYFPTTTFGEISQRSIFHPDLVRSNVSVRSDLPAGSVLQCLINHGDEDREIFVQVTHDTTTTDARHVLERAPGIDGACFVSGHGFTAPQPEDLVIQVVDTHRQYGDVIKRLQSYDADFAPSWLPFSASCFIVGNNRKTNTIYCAVLDEKSPWGQSDVTERSRDAIAHQVAQHYGSGCRIVIVARRAQCELFDSMSLLPLETLPPVAQPSVNKPAEGMRWEPLAEHEHVFGARSAHGVPLRAWKSEHNRMLNLDAWTDRGWQEVGFAECSVDETIDGTVINSLLAGYLRLF